MKDKETLEKVDENKTNLYFKKQVMNPYPEEGYAYTAYEKGFIEGYEESTKWQQEQDKNKYSEEDMIAFGNKMQLVSDVDFDGNVKFAFNPSEAIKQFYNK